MDEEIKSEESQSEPFGDGVAEKEKKTFWQKHRQVILYLIFGTVTTILSLGACWLTVYAATKLWHTPMDDPHVFADLLGSTSQWIVSVICAFVSGKLWVFTDAEKGTGNTWKQFAEFTWSRIATYFMEAGLNVVLIWLLDRLGYLSFYAFGFEITSRVIAKLISSIVVVIVNYYISKLLVFRKKKGTAVS